MADRLDAMTPRKKKDGSTFWHRVGTAWKGDKGINIVFDSLPLPDAEGRVAVSLFEPREQGGGQRQQSNGNRGRDSDVGISGWDDSGAPF